MKYFFCLWIGVVMFIISGISNPVKIFVSPKGKDSNPGTKEKPFATLEKARMAVRMHLRNLNHDSIFVVLREGKYQLQKSFVLDSLDGGSTDAPVIYSAYEKETVRITGGITLGNDKAVPVTSQPVLNRLLPGSRAKVLQVNLKKLGIANYGDLLPHGFGRPYMPAAMELFCNDSTMQLARWPNDSTVPLGKIIDPGSVPRNGDYSKRGATFNYGTTRPSRWTKANDFWISGFFRYGYADDAVKIAVLDTVQKTMHTAQEHLYGFESGKTFQRWFAYNLLEEIDQPGEYYIDRTAGILYFYPREKKLENIQLSSLESPMVMLMNASHVQFSNIYFECSRGMGIYIEKGNNNLVENCIFRNLGLVAISLGKGIAPLENLQHAGTGTPASGVIGNLYAHLYNNTTFDRHAGTGHIIRNCSIYNTGTGGIILGGGNRLTLEKGNNQVINCNIHHFNRLDRSYKAGINIDGVGNIIRNCEISYCPGSAILLHGNDHIMEYNHIHHAVTDGDDMGAIYYGRDPSEQGNKVKFNFFHHLGNDHGLLVATYHDDGACGMEVTGNVFYKAGMRDVLIGGGSDNMYRNNIFIDSKITFHIDNRLMGWAKSSLDKDGIFQKRLEAVNYKQPPYSVAYPELTNYFNENPALPKRNFIENNVFVNVKLNTNGKAEWSNFGKNYTIFGDPGFENYNEMNFKLYPSSEIFKLLPGFKAIAFEKIGLQNQE